MLKTLLPLDRRVSTRGVLSLTVVLVFGAILMTLGRMLCFKAIAFGSLEAMMSSPRHATFSHRICLLGFLVWCLFA